LGSGWIWQGEELVEETGEAGEVVHGLAGEVFGLRAALGSEVDGLHDALEGIVDLVGEVIGHGDAGLGGSLMGEQGALTLVPDGDGGEVGEVADELEVVAVEARVGAVGDDPEGAADVSGDPWDEDAVGDGGSVDADLVEILPGHAKELGVAAIEARGAGAEEPWEDGTGEVGVAAGVGDPAELGVVAAAGLFDGDAGSVGAAEVDGDVDELLEDALGLASEDAGQALHADDLDPGIAGAGLAGAEAGVAGQVDDLEGGEGGGRVGIVHHFALSWADGAGETSTIQVKGSRGCDGRGRMLIESIESTPFGFTGEAMQAMLALEDGRIFRGKGFGARAEASGEVVFNTSLTGYQEIFTDPSYAGQIVVLTNPHIGNYGTTPHDAEASRPYIEGLVTREFSPMSSNWRSTEVADEYLERNGVPVIAGVDTRAVVRHLRAFGVMRGVIASGEALDGDALVAKARAIRRMVGTDLASVVSTKAPYVWNDQEPKNQTGDSLLGASSTKELRHVVAYDFGIKQNILRMLTREGCRVTVVPARTTAEEVMALAPDGVFYSNGPGDPEPLDYAGWRWAARRTS
jgi:hypothetical protein